MNLNLVPGWCHVGSSLGSNFGFVWLDARFFLGPFWVSRSESIFGNLVLLGFHVGSSGALFWKPGDVQTVDFEGPGLTSGPIFGDF